MVLTKKSKKGRELTILIQDCDRLSKKTGEHVNTEILRFVDGDWHSTFVAVEPKDEVINSWMGIGFQEDKTMGVYECWKCTGKGRINGFSHIQGGICFACGGKGLKAKRIKR